MNPFVLKLEHGARLSDKDRTVLAGLTRITRRVGARQRLIDEGDEHPRALVLLEGWACRWRMLDNGQRQITDLLLPGDACHLHTDLLDYADHSVSTISTCTVAEIDPVELASAAECAPNAARALRWSSLQTDSILRETLVNNGQRQAQQGLAHLICEIQARLHAVSMVEDDSFAWPLKQVEMGEVTSMTSVHINRTLKHLRTSGLISLKKQRMTVPNAGKLQAFCGFKPDYLHLRSHFNTSTGKPHVHVAGSSHHYARRA